MSEGLGHQYAPGHHVKDGLVPNDMTIGGYRRAGSPPATTGNDRQRPATKKPSKNRVPEGKHKMGPLKACTVSYHQREWESAPTLTTRQK